MSAGGLQRELFLLLTDPDTTLSDAAMRTVHHVCDQLDKLDMYMATHSLPATEKREPLPEDLFVFLDACAGEGYVMSGIDAADLCLSLFPERYAGTLKDHGIGTHNATGDPA